METLYMFVMIPSIQNIEAFEMNVIFCLWYTQPGMQGRQGILQSRMQEICLNMRTQFLKIIHEQIGDEVMREEIPHQ